MFLFSSDFFVRKMLTREKAKVYTLLKKEYFSFYCLVSLDLFQCVGQYDILLVWQIMKNIMLYAIHTNS